MAVRRALNVSSQRIPAKSCCRFFSINASVTGVDTKSESFAFSSAESESVSDSSRDGAAIHIKGPGKASSSSSVTMPMSFMTGSIVGKRFYEKVTTREAEDGPGWYVMLDYRTLKTPSKRNLRCPTLSLAKAVAAEWEFQQKDGIRPFTMPLMKLTCTAIERVPLTRATIIEHLMKKFHQDLVFVRAPTGNDLTRDLRATVVFAELQVKKFSSLMKWVESEFGYKPIVHTSFFGGKQEEGFVKAVESALKKTCDYELATIDAIAASAHSLLIAIGVARDRLSVEEAVALIRLEEDLQVDRWGLVEGGHDVDIADLRVQISSAAAFLGLSRMR
ncbi:hypothetical protein M569_15333 [Genlisea aurea]|uniref:ATP synthase mitochondrial F1 complex assembly factor 2 n=1 Tax=Genlisea aurea TaxID=192259 RepID=S8BYK6_9LAMI|nr:hypothetical protein M569_15333 [Genlisea aurea]